MGDVKQFSSDKILKHIDKINDWLSNKNPFVVTVEFDPTNKCNNKCPDCVGGREDAPKALISLEQAVRLIDELKELDARGLTFTGGGEPLCNSDSVAMVKYANNKGLDVGFITNGILLNPYTAQVLLENTVWLRVSLDAATPEIYEYTHGSSKKVFEKVIKNIELLVDVKQEINSNTTLGVGFLTNERTSQDIVDFAKLCKELGVDYSQFRPYHLQKHNSEIESNLKKALDFSEDGYNVLFSQHKYECMKQNELGRNYKICYGEQFATVISADMKMYLCCHTRGMEEYILGDLTKNSIQEIWDSEQRKEVIKNIDVDDCIPLCRCNTFNQVLWNIKQEREHKNFL